MGIRLRDEVDVAKRFHRSVNVELDFERADSLDGYVVSPLARDVTMRIAQALENAHGARAWTLIGPYGSGKSSLVAFLAALLCRGPAYIGACERLERNWPNEGPRLRDVLLDDEGIGQLVPVLITGEREPLSRAILRGLHKAAESFWSGRGVNPEVVAQLAEANAAAEAGEVIEHAQIVDLTLEFARKVKASNRPGNGLFIVIDEMGKLLEWAALRPDDVDLYLLQRLAEAAARSKATVGLLTVLHQDISAYAGNLTRSMRDEWTKIGGRFETISYLEPVHHIVRLLDGAITASDVALSTDAASEVRAAAEDLISGEIFRADLPLAGVFPLHPLTALCVGPLFRTAIGQNERSVFAFLNSHEPLGFQDWLAKAEGPALYRLSDLFDYAVHNTRALVEGTRAWSSAEFALSRLNGSADPLEVELVKSIAILTMVRVPAEVRADEATLALATGRDSNAVKKALGRLKKRSVALLVHHRKSWELWDGSDVDIDEVIARHRTDILARGGLAEQIESAVKPTPITASRHYIRSGTFRVLRVRYVSTFDAARRIEPKRGDGVLVIVVPDQLDEVAEVREQLDATPHQPVDEPPRAIVVPENVELFHEQGLDFLAVTQALKLTPELESDPIARRVLQERQLAMRDALQAAHEVACAGTSARPARWRYDGDWHIVEGRASGLASAIFDRAFADAPQVHNELINRAQISSAAAAGRRQLMQRMLTHTGEARLGIVGSPPELSMYRSILERMGIHGETADGWGLTDPPAESPLRGVWARIGELLTTDDAHTGERLSFEAIAEALARPPHGVRAGVAPILIWAWYLVHQESTFLYEENSFVPRPDDALVERLLRQPHHVELQSAALSGRLAEVALAIREHAFPAMKPDGGRLALRVVRRLVLSIKGLSTFAQRTERVSTRTRAMRTALAAAKDTVKLLVVSLPEALGVDLDAPDGPRQLAIGVAEGLAELAQADARLLDEIERSLRDLFGIPGEGASFHREIAERAKALVGARGCSALTQQFIEQTALLDGGDATSREIWLRGVATTIGVKVPEKWTDADIPHFQQRAEERIQNFLAAERLAFQMKRLNGAASRPLLRVDYMTSDDGRRKGQFGLLEDAAAMDQVIEEAKAHVSRFRDLALHAGVTTDHGVAYALLRAMMDTLEGTSVTEDG